MSTTFNELYERVASYGYSVSKEIMEQIPQGVIWMEMSRVDFKVESIENSSYEAKCTVTFYWTETDPGVLIDNMKAFLKKLNTDKWMENRFIFEHSGVRRVGQTYRVFVPVSWVDIVQLP